EIQFENGVPVALDNERMSALDLIIKCNEIAGLNGIGRIDIIEDRIIGLKSRENYEVPAAILLITAHKALEQLTLTRSELKFAAYVSEVYSEIVYDGLWHEPLREDLDALIDNMQKRVTGTVKVRLHKGNLRILGRESPYSLYSEETVSFEDKGMDQREMAGMVKNYGIQAATFNRVCKRD
ncbi:MAG: argininosuccinate synthase, partial [Methanobacterium sp.]